MKKILSKTQISEKIDEFIRLRKEYYNNEKYRHQFSVLILTGDPTWTGITNPTTDLFTERMMSLSMNYSIAEINVNAIGNWIQFIMSKSDDYSTNIDGDLVGRICAMYEEV